MPLCSENNFYQLEAFMMRGGKELRTEAVPGGYSSEWEAKKNAQQLRVDPLLVFFNSNPICQRHRGRTRGSF